MQEFKAGTKNMDVSARMGTFVLLVWAQGASISEYCTAGHPYRGFRDMLVWQGHENSRNVGKTRGHGVSHCRKML